MEATIPTPPASSTVTASSVSHHHLHLPFHLLEITLISAQDISPVSKSMRTYAVAWVQPNRKLNTRIHQGHTNPTWNDKFVFRVEDDFLTSDTAAVTIEIYNVSWFRDVLVGTVRVLINNLITPSLGSTSASMRYVALQIRRPSGTPQGILNMGVLLLDTTMRSMPLYSQLSTSASASAVGGYPRDLMEDKKTHNGSIIEDNQDDDDEKQKINARIQLWRSLSVGTDIINDDFPPKPGSVVNGSLCNGSVITELELCSDVGPSASVVAAEIAKGLHSKGLNATAEVDETGSSILEELTPQEATAKGLTSNIERWRKELPPKPEGDPDRDQKPQPEMAHSRRHSDGGGLFSCFGNAYGFEFTIVCGASNNNNNNINNNKTSGRNRKKRPGDQNSI